MSTTTRMAKKSIWRFYLKSLQPVLGLSGKAWVVEGFLEHTKGVGEPVFWIQSERVSIMRASKYDALCALADKLAIWGVRAEDIFTC